MPISRVLYQRFIPTLPYPTGSYAGKTIVVTGSNIGLGRETARHYARLGASKLILAVRNVQKGIAAKEEILSTTGVADNIIEIWPLDLASYDSVLTFANRLDVDLPRLDIFIANAAVAMRDFSTAERDELVITVNVVSSTLLALLVLPLLKRTANGHGLQTHLCVVSSGAAFSAKFAEQSAPDGHIFTALSDEHRADMQDRYPVSKLLQLFAMRSICEQLPSTSPVTINAVTPGFCRSALSRNSSWGLWAMQQLLARSTEWGSRPIVHAADQGLETHKKFLRDGQVVDESPFIRSAEGKKVQDRVWNELVQKLEEIRPGVTRW